MSSSQSAEVTSAAPLVGVGAIEKPFDEYHLYTLQRPSTLENGETKQVEFLRGSSIASKRIFVYEGYVLPANLHSNWEYQFQQPTIGLTSNKKIYIMREVSQLAGQPPGYSATQGAHALLPA